MLGTTLQNRYRLDAELGRGGMGVIYSAYDTLLDRAVAVKVLSQKSWGSEGRARLLREAQAAARLNHPNIVAIHDAGEANGVPFIVMELVEGTSLYDRPPESLEEMLDIARQVCTALEHAHTHNIVHRDLKPENILLVREARLPSAHRAGNGAMGVRVKLTDFGLARSVASRLTADGTITGTVFYMAPELVLGQTFDGRADLYALGVMLYELVTDRLPFNGDEPVQIISQHLYAPVVPPSTYRPDLLPALDALIVRLMSKRPEDRPATALEVRQALERLDTPPLASALPIELSLLDRIAHGRLVGREREVAEMIGQWRRASAGEPHVLVVSGEPGIGKTRLVRELMAQARLSGSRVLAGECYAEAGAPFAPIAQIIRAAIPESDLAWLRPTSPLAERAGMGLGRAAALSLGPVSDRASPPGVLSPPRGLSPLVFADLLRLAPDLRASHPDLDIGEPTDAQVDQQRLFESVFALCSRLAARAPLLIFVDDVHWADNGTLSLLRHLARRGRTARLRLLIVMAYREVELDETGPLQDVLLDFTRERLATRLKLARLDREQTHEMLESMFAADTCPPEFVDNIYRETEGNPFFVEEVCKALVEEGQLRLEAGQWCVQPLAEISVPQSVRATIHSRLAKLPAPAQDVLRLAAILGRDFDFDTLKAASELDEDALISAVEIAERAQLIREERRGARMAFVFAHALIPSTLREDVSGLRRQRLHRRAAAAIEAVRPDNFEALAQQYEHAGDAERAWSYTIKAADRALSLYSNQDAETHYRAALDLGLADAGRGPAQTLDRARALSGLGEAVYRQGRSLEAIQIWKEAIELYASQNDSDQQAQLYARSARAAWAASDRALGLNIVRAGLASLAGQPEGHGMAALLRAAAGAYFFNGLADEARRYGQAALDAAERIGDVEVQVEALATLGVLPDQPPDAARQALTRAVTLAESAGLLAVGARAHNNLGVTLEADFGELSAARDQFLKARDMARRMGVASEEFVYLINATYVALWLGDLALVEEALPALQRLLAAGGAPRQATTGLRGIEAQLLFHRGEWDEAIGMLLPARDEARRLGDLDFVCFTNIYLAGPWLELGKLDQAEAALTEAVQVAHDSQGDWVAARCLLGAVHARLGRHEAARRLIDEARTRPGRRLSTYDRVSLALAEARLAAAASPWSAASAAFEAALTFAGQIGARWHQARIILEWAESRPADADDPAHLVERLRGAKALFETMGTPRYVALAEYQLWLAERAVVT